MAKLSDLIDDSMEDCTPSFKLGVFIASLDILERDLEIYSPELHKKLFENFTYLTDNAKYRFNNYLECQRDLSEPYSEDRT